MAPDPTLSRNYRETTGRPLKRKDFHVTAVQLERCREILVAMNAATTAWQISHLWSDYLSGSQRVFSKLAAAATAGESSAWFGRIKRRRKDDELLQYAHQARHADEHGKDQIANAKGRTWGLEPAHGAKLMKINKLIVKQGVIEHLDADNAELVIKPADAKLFPVTNQGQVYYPPQSHLGKPWTNNTAVGVAHALQKFMDETVAEASKFVDD